MPSKLFNVCLTTYLLRLLHMRESVYRWATDLSLKIWLGRRKRDDFVGEGGGTEMAPKYAPTCKNAENGRLPPVSSIYKNVSNAREDDMFSSNCILSA